jgi:hypothetical protein
MSYNDYTNIFEYSLNTLLESNSIIINALQNDSYITEVFENQVKKVFNISVVFDSIIQAFVSAMEKIIDKFISMLVYLAGMGKAFDLECRAFKDDIANFSDSVAIENAYTFTNLKLGYFPDPSLKTYFSDSVNSLINNFNKAVESSTNANAVIKKIKSDDFSVEEKHAKFRIYLLNGRKSDYGDNEFISNDRFATECFKIFRNGEESASSVINVYGRDVYNNYFIPYFEMGKLKAAARKECSVIQASCKDAKKQINKFNLPLDKFPQEDREAILNVYNTVRRNVCTLFNLECKDVVVLYGSKLQAYRDSYVQARKVIMKCMQKIATKTPSNIIGGAW